MAGGVLNSGFLAEGVIRELLEKLSATSPCLLAGHVKLAKLQLKKSCCYRNVVYHTFDQVGQRPTSLLDGSSVLVSTLLAAPYISEG